MRCQGCSYGNKLVKTAFSKTSKARNCLCKNCNRQLIYRMLFKYRKRDDEVRINETIIRFLERGIGMRDIQHLLKFGKTKILRILEKFSLRFQPKLKSYKSVQYRSVVVVCSK